MAPQEHIRKIAHKADRLTTASDSSPAWLEDSTPSRTTPATLHGNDGDAALTIEDLGSLKQFVSFSWLGKDTAKLVETIPFLDDTLPPDLAWDLPASCHNSDHSVLDDQQEARFVSRAPRRQVQRVGDKVNLRRSKCPRHLQLVQILTGASPTEAQASPQKQLPVVPAAESARGTPRAATAPATSARAAEQPREPPRRGSAATSIASDQPASARASSRASKERDAAAAPPAGAAPKQGADAASRAPERRRPQSQGVPASSSARKTNFDVSFVMGTTAKPRPEKHHLLTRLQKEDEVKGTFREMDTARNNLTRRMEDLRAGDHSARPGGDPVAGASGRAATAERRPRLPAGDEELHRSGHTASVPYGGGSRHLPMRHARSSEAAGRERLAADLKELTRLMDPDGVGSIPSGVFIPLFFWLGLTQHQAAALATLRLAFGPGEAVPMSIMKDLIRFAEVEIRLAEGLRRYARLSSVMPLCEFLADCDGWRLRNWFHSMRHDLDGRVDVAELQRWLAQTEIITDRQALFRFLCQVTHGEVIVNTCSGVNACKAWATRPSSGYVTMENGSGTENFGEVKHRGGFSLDDFASMLCRCVITWCLHRTLQLLADDPAKRPREMGPAGEENEEEAPLEVRAAAWGQSSSLAMRWTQLQRKIAVSFLVNGDFWGRESRAVMGSMKPTEAACGGEDLSPEQWNLLFQRARAQGLASTLPTSDEVAAAKAQRSSMKKAGLHGHHTARS